MHLPDEIDLSVCRLLTSWDALEKRLGGRAVIDFNLADFSDPESEMRYNSRRAVLNDLVDLQHQPEIRSCSHVAKKLRAQEVYLRNVMGEHWEFSTYIKSTIGFTPALIAEDALEAQRKRIAAVLSHWNINFDAELEEKFNAVQDVIPHGQIANFYNDVHARSLETLTSMIGVLTPFSFTVEVADEDAYWQAWVDGNGLEYRLRFNTRTMPLHFKAVSTLYALHEVTSHMVQASMIHKHIQSGNMPRCMGLTTVHGPEQFQLEGLAQTIQYFLDNADAQEPSLMAAGELYIYRQMVQRNNSHIMINSGCSVDECTDYVAKRMPYKDIDDIAHSFSNKVNNPQFRCYEHVYGVSGRFFQDIALQSTPKQKQVFLQRVYNEWLTPDELVQFKRELLHE